jgi:hypothetical protein
MAAGGIVLKGMVAPRVDVIAAVYPIIDEGSMHQNPS